MRIQEYLLAGAFFLANLGYTSVAEDTITIKDRGPHQQTIEYLTTSRDEEGNDVTTKHSLVELATGLNYWDGQDWAPASAAIEIVNDHGVVRKAQHQVSISGVANDPNGLLDVLMPDGRQRLVIRPVGIAVTEGKTGRSVFIATVKGGDGFVEGEGRDIVTFSDAFDNIKADIRIQSRIGSVECDVVLHEKLDRALLQDYGISLEANPRIEVWHQVLVKPEASTEVSYIPRLAGAEATDEVNFGSMRLEKGRSFAVGQDQEVGGLPGAGGLAVSKAWVRVGDLDWLIESIPFLDAEPELQKLPARQQARVDHKSDVQKAFAQLSPQKGRIQPVSLRSVQEGEGKALAQDSGGPSRYRGLRRRSVEGGKAVALAERSPGYLIDYSLVTSTMTNKTFESGVTYWVPGQANLYGLTTFNGGAVVKFTNYTSLSPYLFIHENLDCRTSPGHPIIFTAKDDETVGDWVPGTTGTPSTTSFYGLYAMAFDWGATNVLDVHDFQTRYCHVGVAFYRYASNNVWNATIYNCDRGIEVNFNNLAVRNALLWQTHYAFNGAESSNPKIYAEHVTVDKAQILFLSASFSPSLLLTNSLLCAITNDNSTRVFSNYTSTVTSSDFQTVGAGAHYLSVNSQYRNAGTSQLSKEMRAILVQSTTYPPIHLTSDFTTDTTLYPVVSRDTDIPDLGYHYGVIDYLWNDLNLTNATLTLTNGVSVALYGVYGGVHLQNGSKVISEGTSRQLNRIMTCGAVQEKPDSPGYQTRYLFYYEGPAAPRPEAQFRFTEFPLLAAYLGYNQIVRSAYSLSTLSFTDCQLYNPTLSLDVRSESAVEQASFVNNLIVNPDFSFQHSHTYSGEIQLTFRNNLLRYGQMLVWDDWSGTDHWSTTDNMLDEVNYTNYPSSTPISFGYNAYNAFRNTTVPPDTSGQNVSLTNTFAFTNGPLGSYYQLSTNCYDKGSATADAVGFYHYTVVPDQTKETTSQVDIGFHYPAVQKVQFVGTDYSTQGNWKGVYGAEGYEIIDDAVQYPWYASVTTANLHSGIWVTNSTDVRYLQRVESATNRLAAYWVNDYSTTSICEINLRLSDLGAHRVSFYCLDEYSGGTRQQRFDLMTPDGAYVLDTRTVTTYSNGEYLTWDICGDVKVRITALAGFNQMVVSGLFFDTATLTPGDTDGDGLWDVTEDRDGNGAVDSGETDWSDANDLGFRVFISQPKDNSNIP